MTLFDDQRAEFSRTPQSIVVLGVRYCENHYASGVVPNQLTRSEELDHADWFKSSVTVDANAGTDPLGTSTADRINYDADLDFISQGGNVACASKTFNGSVWLRAESGTQKVTLRMDNTSATVEALDLQCILTTEWQRFRLSQTYTGAAGGNARLMLRRVAGDATASILAWGAQLTEGAATLSYVKNVGSRNNASACQATAQSDGNRCYYSFPTCQDPANFRITHDGPPPRGIREFKFCFQDAPLPLPGEDVLPLLASVEHASQRIDPERAVTITEKLSAELREDFAPGIWDAAKSSAGALVNTAEGGGSFWPRFLAIFKNYANPSGYAILKVGFVASGMTESLYEQRFRGLIRNIQLSQRGGVSVECSDRLKLLKAQHPPKISESNLLNGAVNSAVTTFTVDDATQITPPGSGYTVTLQFGNASAVVDADEKVNVTAVDILTNQITVQRGRWGTAAASHVDNALFRELIECGTERTTPSDSPVGKNPIDLTIELLKRGGLLAADIDEAGLQSERDTWMPSTINLTTGATSGTVFRRTIIQPQELEVYLTEIRELIMLYLWVGEDQVITGKLFAPARPNVTLRTLTDEANFISGSSQVDDNDQSRLTRVIIAYDLASGESGESIGDYNKVFARIGNSEESSFSYGDRREKVLLSKWIGASHTLIPPRLSSHLLARFRNGARKLTAKVEEKDGGVRVGDFVAVTTRHIQRASGAKHENRIMQVLRKKPDGKSTIELEMLDTGLIRRYGFISPNGTPVYDSATEAQRRYAFIGRASTNLVGSTLEDGYYMW